MSPFCVLVASSDSRKDIFDVCFANSERIWRNCDWPRYVGFNTPSEPRHGFEVIAAPPMADWCKQVAAYIDQLPDHLTRILLMVEDAVFIEPVDMAKLKAAATKAAFLDYLRLVPIRRSWIGRFDHAVGGLGYATQGIELIALDDPYYASTEMAIWNRSYLLRRLRLPVDAWTFEHRWDRDVGHWATTNRVFAQHQVVQKGRWNWDAPWYLKQAGCPPPSPARPYQTLRARLRGHWQNLNFRLLGFTTTRIRRAFSK